MEKRDWQALVEEWDKSGLSRSEFCRRKAISASSFHPYVVKSRLSQSLKPKAENNQKFIKLGTSDREFIEIDFPWGLRARIPANEEMLKLLLESSREIIK